MSAFGDKERTSSSNAKCLLLTQSRHDSRLFPFGPLDIRRSRANGGNGPIAQISTNKISKRLQPKAAALVGVTRQEGYMSKGKLLVVGSNATRSEERRVGKECRQRC